MVVLLDTGILLRLVDRNDPMHASVRAAVRAVKVRGDTLTMTAQNLAEFWNVCTRPVSARGGLGLSTIETHRRLRLLERIIGILPDSPNAYPIWKNLVASLGVCGVQVHDARLVALMKVHGAAHIMTLNVADFARYSEMIALDPRTSISFPAPQGHS